MKRIIKILCALFLTTLGIGMGCAAPGTVDNTARQGLLTPVMERADAYIALNPGGDYAAYKQAKLDLANLPSSGRSRAALAWVSVSEVCKVHDGFVAIDQNLDEVHRKTYLRSTEILLKMYSAAFQAEGKPAPASVESRPVGASLCLDGSCKRG